MSKMDMSGFEQRVRDRAYALWEREGRPAGRDAEHWRLSEEATLAEFAQTIVEEIADPAVEEIVEAAFAKPAAKPKAAAPRKKKAATAKRSPASVEMAASL